MPFSSGDASFDGLSAKRYVHKKCERLTASDKDFAVVAEFVKRFGRRFQWLTVDTDEIRGRFTSTRVTDGHRQYLISPENYDRLIPGLLDVADALDSLAESAGMELNYDDDEVPSWIEDDEVVEEHEWRNEEEDDD